MENVKNDQEIFEVLGLRLKLKKEELTEGVMPREVVDYVQSEVNSLLNSSQHLTLNQVAILALLKVAQDKIALEKNTKMSLSELKSTTRDALSLIEEVLPTNH